MRRREFITLLGGAAAWPPAARAQQPGQLRRLGVLIGVSGPDGQARAEQSLAKLGWTVGRNLAIDYRWGVNEFGEKANLAVAQILRITPDVILANGGPALVAAQQATHTVPIIFTSVSEPVERGFVTSMAHPGGNTTGFTNLEATVGGKWVELLKEMAPHTSRVTAMFKPASSFAVLFFRSAEIAGRSIGVDVVAAHVNDLAEFDTVCATLAREPNSASMLPPDGFTQKYRRQLIDLTARYHLPCIAGFRQFTADGGLMSYGHEGVDEFHRAASYIDRVLKGEKPGDLLVQSPVKFDLVINHTTARALGLDVPAQLLALADEVLE
jgi:putative tryptophan/tyrosine transport system substrate-binding protein